MHAWQAQPSGLWACLPPELCLLTRHPSCACCFKHSLLLHLSGCPPVHLAPCSMILSFLRLGPHYFSSSVSANGPQLAQVCAAAGRCQLAGCTAVGSPSLAAAHEPARGIAHLPPLPHTSLLRPRPKGPGRQLTKEQHRLARQGGSCREAASSRHVCRMPHATCRMPHAACRMPHAACHMPHATCHVPHPGPLLACRWPSCGRRES